MRASLLCLVLVGCSSSSTAESETLPDRAAMESVVVGSWSGSYDAAHGALLVLDVRSKPAVQPKCGTHIVSTKCVTMTELDVESDAHFGTENVTMTGTVTADGSTAEYSYFHLVSAAGDTLSCTHKTDRWVDCRVRLHGADYGPFELTHATR
jgi:hypothetical protein